MYLIIYIMSKEEEYISNYIEEYNNQKYTLNEFNKDEHKNDHINDNRDNHNNDNKDEHIDDHLTDHTHDSRKITVSLTNIITDSDFRTLNKRFAKLSNKNQTISRSDLESLISHEIESVKCQRHHFIDQYLNHYGNNYRFSFIDYYTISIHLQNLNNINIQKSLDLSKKATAAQYEQTMLDLEYQQSLSRVSIEEKMLKLSKERGNINKEQLRQNSMNKYELEVELYSKKNLGLTCVGYLNRVFNCFGQNVIKDYDQIYDIIKELPTLNNYQKNLILIRFQTILKYCIKHFNIISRWYNSSQMFIIACSIINPALLSINSDKENPHYFSIFWSVWISQLLVSLVTSYVAYFKWDKKYFLFNSYKSRINQEIWYFIELSGGPYKNNNSENIHSDYILVFLNRLERLYKHLKLSEFEIENTSNEEENNNKEKNTPKIPIVVKDDDDKDDTNSGNIPISPKTHFDSFLERNTSDNV